MSSYSNDGSFSNWIPPQPNNNFFENIVPTLVNNSNADSTLVPWVGTLINYDQQYICDVTSNDCPFKLADELEVRPRYPNISEVFDLQGLPNFSLRLHGGEGKPLGEWRKFLGTFIPERRVAVLVTPGWEMVCYSRRVAEMDARTVLKVFYRAKPPGIPWVPPSTGGEPKPKANEGGARLSVAPDVIGQAAGSSTIMTFANSLGGTASPGVHPNMVFVTLPHTHSAFLFGGLAELVDNARDAKATRLEISTRMGDMSGRSTPILAVCDNGVGMSHASMVRMLSLSHKAPEEEDRDIIGRFGVGFKSGSMRVGEDVLVLSQCLENGGGDQRVVSRSIGFLSYGLNRDKESLELPIISYRKVVGGTMSVDLSVMTELEERERMASIKAHSPFDAFSIGAEFSKMEGPGNTMHSGTRIFIFNLQQEAGAYQLDWQSEENNILTTSKRARSRTGQFTKDVPLDYSLRAYLALLFLEPRMTIELQGLEVTARLLEAELQKQVVTREAVQALGGKVMRLVMGELPGEREGGRCGIFIYWHGRLIEAYKRVGRMGSADVGLGILGVIDITDLKVGVLNSKQGFDDTDDYASLIEWLGQKFNELWETSYDIKCRDDQEMERLRHVPEGVTLIADRPMAMCEACGNWRFLAPGYDEGTLPDQWYCWLPPYEGSCKDPPEATEELITTWVGRTTQAQAVGAPLEATNAAGTQGTGVSSSAASAGAPSARPTLSSQIFSGGNSSTAALAAGQRRKAVEIPGLAPSTSGSNRMNATRSPALHPRPAAPSARPLARAATGTAPAMRPTRPAVRDFPMGPPAGGAERPSQGPGGQPRQRDPPSRSVGSPLKRVKREDDEGRGH
eukprot:TRINITY_DN14683_c0_g1_i1.p1 TRINITY_DN14683_c0_g1~~TRINITY_DN14683_c0_g1_i1.p1  ORF type:complete len:849 (+),score=134.69 TRINITY_DN14683_c0_g1_i1:1553-4099(+)